MKDTTRMRHRIFASIIGCTLLRKKSWWLIMTRERMERVVQGERMLGVFLDKYRESAINGGPWARVQWRLDSQWYNSAMSKMANGKCSASLMAIYILIIFSDNCVFFVLNLWERLCDEFKTSFCSVAPCFPFFSSYFFHLLLFQKKKKYFFSNLYRMN